MSETDTTPEEQDEITKVLCPLCSGCGTVTPEEYVDWSAAKQADDAKSVDGVLK